MYPCSWGFLSLSFRLFSLSSYKQQNWVGQSRVCMGAARVEQQEVLGSFYIARTLLHTRRRQRPALQHSLQGLHAHGRSELLKDDKLKGSGGANLTRWA